MKLIPIKPEEQSRGQGGYICADCWINDDKETQATVFLRSTKQIGANGYPCQHALCSNHAEMLDPSILDEGWEA